jgi:hypothetical protein
MAETARLRQKVSQNSNATASTRLKAQSLSSCVRSQISYGSGHREGYQLITLCAAGRVKNGSSENF